MIKLLHSYASIIHTRVSLTCSSIFSRHPLSSQFFSIETIETIMLHCILPRKTLLPLTSRRCLTSKTKCLPSLDPRNRVLHKAESNLKVISQEKEAEISDPPRKKAALYTGSVTTLAGLGLASYTHSAALFTTDNLTISMITLGSGMLLFSLKDHDSISKLFSKDKDNESDKKSIFTFKLLNEKNIFSKELRGLESTCPSENNKWPVEVQSKLDTLLSQDVSKLEQEIAVKRSVYMKEVTVLLLIN